VTASSPRVVAIGGGHGLASTLAGLAEWCDHITAVVSVADDGGSSGRLRHDLGIPAPGDMRRCLMALTPRGRARDALEHRFESGDLRGHAAGNVLLAAMLEVSPDPVDALDSLALMVGARGRVLPATLAPVDLIAFTPSGEVRGQVAVSAAKSIDRIRTDPRSPRTPAAVKAAIADADAIVIGPGSLFTSVLAALVPEVVAEVCASQAVIVFVANLDLDDDESSGLTLADHVSHLRRHGIDPDVVLADTVSASDSVVSISDGSSFTKSEFVFRSIARPNRFLHDPEALGAALRELVRPVRA